MPAAYYDFFRKIVLQPDGVTLEADSVTDTLTITGSGGVALNPNASTDSFEIDVDYQLYVPLGTTELRLQDVNANTSIVNLTAGTNVAVTRISDTEVNISATVGGASKSISSITLSNPVVITTNTAHSFTEGRPVTITDVVGTVELNGNEYYMDILTGTTFALYHDDALTNPVDGLPMTSYSSGGVATGEYFPRTQLSELSDVETTGVQTNDILAYDGTNFVPTSTLIGSLEGTVGATTPAAGTFSSLRTSESEIILGLNAKSGATNVGYGDRAISIGEEAGLTYQDDDSIAIGYRAADDGIGQRGISIGWNSGPGSALVLDSISLGGGAQAGGNLSVAIGRSAQAGGLNNISIGNQAGYNYTVDGAITIGAYTNRSTGVAANTITINATNDQLNPVNNLIPNSFVVKPVRQAAGPYYLKYDDTSGEVTYASASDFVVGDLQGSVFADDSTTLVDAVNSKIVGDVETASLKLSSTSPSFLITDTDGSGNGLTQTLEFKKYLTSGYQIQAISNSGQSNLHIRVDSGYQLSIYQTAIITSVPWQTNSYLIFEGANNDNFETFLVASEPLQDATVTIPNTTGTIALTSDVPATTDNLTEGSTNLYFTDARAATATTGRAIAMSMIFGG